VDSLKYEDAACLSGFADGCVFLKKHILGEKRDKE
jgi:hypothetical protein